VIINNKLDSPALDFFFFLFFFLPTVELKFKNLPSIKTYFFYFILLFIIIIIILYIIFIIIIIIIIIIFNQTNTFTWTKLDVDTGGTNDEVETTDLRTNPSQEGGDDEMPRAKGPTRRAMARRIQEEWALNVHARPKMNFTLAKEDVKT